MSKKRIQEIQIEIHALQLELRSLLEGSHEDVVHRCKKLRDSGQVIAAIKLWRGEIGTSLSEARTAVEAL